MWHQACTKDFLAVECLRQRVSAWGEVDAECRAGDATFVLPINKVPCTAHLNKNTVGSLVTGIDTAVGGRNQQFRAWIVRCKPGMGYFYLENP